VCQVFGLQVSFSVTFCVRWVARLESILYHMDSQSLLNLIRLCLESALLLDFLLYETITKKMSLI
jgi:hypothetical protein